jgi:hypothetical protein
MAKIAGTKEIDGKNVVIEFDVTLKSFKGNFDIYVDWSKFNWWHPLEKDLWNEIITGAPKLNSKEPFKDENDFLKYIIDVIKWMIQKGYKITEVNRKLN